LIDPAASSALSVTGKDTVIGKREADIQTPQQGLLAVHPGALGDVVLFGHLLSRLAGRVTLAAGGEKGPLLVGAGVAAASLDFSALPMHEVFTDTPPERCALPALLGRHDRLVSCFASGDSRAELRLAALCGAADAIFLPTQPPEDFQRHLLDLWGDLLGYRFSPSAAAPWNTPAGWRERARSELRRARAAPDRPYVLIHPGSGGQAKCWLLEDFLAVAERLGNAVFVVGPVELDRWEAGAIDRLRSAGPLLTCPPLEILAGAAAGAAAFVGNDSGPTHLAAAFGAPTVALFGPTNPVHFAPVGRCVHVLIAGAMEGLSRRRVLRAVISAASADTTSS